MQVQKDQLPTFRAPAQFERCVCDAPGGRCIPCADRYRVTKKQVNYAESDDEEEDVFRPLSVNATKGRAAKRRKISVQDDSDDDFGIDPATEAAMAEERDGAGFVLVSTCQELIDAEMDDFVVPDASDEDIPPSRPRKKSTQSHKPTPSTLPAKEAVDVEMEDLDMPRVSTAQQWQYDPEAPPSTTARIPATTPKSKSANGKKQKAHMTEPDQRYPWLAVPQDMDRNPPGHPDFDPRTIYIPPGAWNNFSAFEKQYWEIKQKFWDTIVFFKKGKFYELYENDATIGHQLFDLKLTDRVNMRMVGVPESSLDHWANQFVAKGFKIARVDQMESALGKDMRERGEKAGGKPKKEEKVIRRELASVLTAGTLVDGGMLQDDMSTFCAAIKETECDGLPAFGIAFVDTATAQFHLTDFIDDADMTKFETFVAQTRPGEILLEKVSTPGYVSRGPTDK